MLFFFFFLFWVRGKRTTASPVNALNEQSEVFQNAKRNCMCSFRRGCISHCYSYKTQRLTIAANIALLNMHQCNHGWMSSSASSAHQVEKSPNFLTDRGKKKHWHRDGEWKYILKNTALLQESTSCVRQCMNKCKEWDGPWRMKCMKPVKVCGKTQRSNRNSTYIWWQVTGGGFKSSLSGKMSQRAEKRRVKDPSSQDCGVW